MGKFVKVANVNLKKDFNEKFKSGDLPEEQRFFIEEVLDNLTVTLDDYYVKELLVNGSSPEPSKNGDKVYFNVSSMPAVYNRMKLDENEAKDRLERDDEFGKIAEITIVVED